MKSWAASVVMGGGGGGGRKDRLQSSAHSIRVREKALHRQKNVLWLRPLHFSQGQKGRVIRFPVALSLKDKVPLMHAGDGPATSPLSLQPRENAASYVDPILNVLSLK